jgi:hypothetical protein
MAAGSRKKLEHSIGWPADHLKMGFMERFRISVDTHKRVYRIYRELELNLRIKPRKRIVREKPEPLAVPEAINHCWSMDFMPGQVGTIN